MRVGVTGAGGYVGRALVRRLLAGGHTVTALLREADPAVFPGGVTLLRGDIRAADAVGALALASDAVVHAAAYVHRAADAPAARAECFAVNEGGTRAVVAALAATGTRPHLVLVSTTAVYGAVATNAHEGDVPRPESAYGESKLAAERCVIEAARAGSITGCVLRPAVVYGVGAPGNTERLLRLIRRGWVPRIRGGANRKSMVHVDDLAEAITRATEHAERVNGRTYNVAGNAVSVDTLVRSLARGAGATVRWLPLPSAPAALAAGAAAAASRLSRGRIPDLSRAFEAFAGEASVDATAIAADLGLTFRSTPEALEEVARESLRAQAR